MANQNNTTKKEEVKAEEKQEQNPEENKTNEQPAAENGKKDCFEIFGLEIRKAPKKEKGEKPQKQPKATKWGLGKTVAVTTAVVTVVGAAAKVAEVAINAFSGNGRCDGDWDPDGYGTQARIEGEFQDIPAENSSVSESTNE